MSTLRDRCHDVNPNTGGPVFYPRYERFTERPPMRVFRRTETHTACALIRAVVEPIREFLDEHSDGGRVRVGYTINGEPVTRGELRRLGWLVGAAAP